MKKAIFIILVGLLFSINGIGQTQHTENTLRLDKTKTPEKAAISDIEWISGVWQGKGFGGDVKEVWTKTGGGEMIGMFSFVKEKKPVFFEFMKFAVENGNLVLRIKHFNPDMVGWEEKDKTVDFKFIKKDRNRMYFSGLTFEKIGDDKLTIYLALTSKDKTVREEVFKFSRSK